MKSAVQSHPRPHDDGVALIVVGGVSWPAHIAVEPEILLGAEALHHGARTLRGAHLALDPRFVLAVSDTDRLHTDWPGMAVIV